MSWVKVGSKEFKEMDLVKSHIVLFDDGSLSWDTGNFPMAIATHVMFCEKP